MILSCTPYVLRHLAKILQESNKNFDALFYGKKTTATAWTEIVLNLHCRENSLHNNIPTQDMRIFYILRGNTFFVYAGPLRSHCAHWSWIISVNF